MVMGGDSCSEGRGFETQHLILDGHLSHIPILVVKITMFVRKEAWMALFNIIIKCR